MDALMNMLESFEKSFVLQPILIFLIIALQPIVGELDSTGIGIFFIGISVAIGFKKIVDSQNKAILARGTKLRFLCLLLLLAFISAMLHSALGSLVTMVCYMLLFYFTHCYFNNKLMAFAIAATPIICGKIVYPDQTMHFVVFFVVSLPLIYLVHKFKPQVKHFLGRLIITAENEFKAVLR